jgi:hypothetical protein
MSEWQPIETAPLHQQVLMSWSDGRLRIGSRYSQSSGAIKCELESLNFYASLYESDDLRPIQWTPLPKPPAAKETAND